MTEAEQIEMTAEEKIDKVYLEIKELRNQAIAEYNCAISVKVHELPEDPMGQWRAIVEQIQIKIKELNEMLCDAGIDNRKYQMI
jgi:hypothetical protein